MAENRIIEPASSSSIQQPPTSTSHINPVIPLISAEIHVDNQMQSSNNNRSSTLSSPSSSGGGGSVIASETSAGNLGTTSKVQNDDDEPEAKRKKVDNGGNTSIQHEKLEYRLGGILCCAVCLDLPKTAMYQVSSLQINNLHSYMYI